MVAKSDSGTPRAFGEVLRRYRVAAGLTQEGLAERAGLSARGLSDLERGLRNWPHADTVRRLAAALDLDDAAHTQLLAAATPRTARDEVDRLNAAVPLQLTSFVGRDGEVAAVQQQLVRSRLVTLTGPGGIGKTRLAIQVAQSEPGRVHFVDLVPVLDAALVSQTLAASLGVREQPGSPILSTLIAALHDVQLLLVFDNCEHVLPGCREVIDALLRGCPDLHILATSRTVVGVPGETVWSVPPLAAPDASALFVERAQSARPGFVLDVHTAPGVADVCQKLDGVPLGIELAAARLRVLGVDQIAGRLDRALTLLVDGPPTAAPRHQALRAALDWSYALLAEPERSVFERVAVFSGGWSVEAAEEVCEGDDVARVDVLDLLGRLVDQSLVVAEPGDAQQMRFRLLEPVRQYAVEKLETHGDGDAARRRHAAHYTLLVERVGFQWAGNDLSRVTRLDAENGNLRAALRWMIDHGEAEPALQLASGAAYYWQQRGYASEGRAWLLEILALPNESRSVARARALIYGSALVAEQGDYVTARPMLDEALSIAREVDDGPTLGFALFRVAQLTWFRREFAEARALAQEGVAVGNAAGLPNLAAINLWQVAQATHDMGEPGAQALAERAVAIFSELGNPTMLGCALTTLAQVYLVREDLSTARELADRAVAAHPPEFQGVAQMFSNVTLGWVATEQADLATAYAALEVALRMARDALGARARLVTPLEGLAHVAAASDQPELALHLAGAAARLRHDYGTPPTPTEVRQLQRWLNRARAQLDASAAAAAWRFGEQRRPEQAIAEALALELPRYSVVSFNGTHVRTRSSGSDISSV